MTAIVSSIVISVCPNIGFGNVLLIQDQVGSIPRFPPSPFPSPLPLMTPCFPEDVTVDDWNFVVENHIRNTGKTEQLSCAFTCVVYYKCKAGKVCQIQYANTKLEIFAVQTRNRAELMRTVQTMKVFAMICLQVLPKSWCS